MQLPLTIQVHCYRDWLGLSNLVDLLLCRQSTRFIQGSGYGVEPPPKRGSEAAPVG